MPWSTTSTGNSIALADRSGRGPRTGGTAILRFFFRKDSVQTALMAIYSFIPYLIREQNIDKFDVRPRLGNGLSRGNKGER